MLLRSWSQAAINRSIASPDISPQTEIYIKCEAFAKALVTAQRDFAVNDTDRMPDTATGAALLKFCRLYGVTQKAGAGSSGFVTYDTNATGAQGIVTGTELVDDLGQRFQVSPGGSFSDGDRIPIRAITIGAATNLAEGTKLRWLSPPPSAASKVAVYTGGLTGGSDPETESELRKRLVEVIGTRPGSLNWAAINQIGESGDPSVQKCFTYPAYLGPNSLMVAVVQAPTASNRNRDVGTLVLRSVRGALLAELAGWVDLSVVSVTNVPVNLSLNLALADDQWINDSQFPADLSVGYCAVVSKTSDTVMVIGSDIAPIAGVSAVCWVPTSSQTIKRATVSSFTTVSAGVYEITLDAPMTGIVVGDWLFPDANRMDDYVAGLFDFFATMGPGELVNDTDSYPGLYPRALRKPGASSSWLSNLGPSVLKVISTLGDEVLDLDWAYRSYTSPNDVTPQLPLGSAPRILVPSKIAFYPM